MQWPPAVLWRQVCAEGGGWHIPAGVPGHLPRDVFRPRVRFGQRVLRQRLPGGLHVPHPDCDPGAHSRVVRQRDVSYWPDMLRQHVRHGNELQLPRRVWRHAVCSVRCWHRKRARRDLVRGLYPRHLRAVQGHARVFIVPCGHVEHDAFRELHGLSCRHVLCFGWRVHGLQGSGGLLLPFWLCRRRRCCMPQWGVMRWRVCLAGALRNRAVQCGRWQRVHIVSLRQRCVRARAVVLQEHLRACRILLLEHDVRFRGRHDHAVWSVPDVLPEGVH